MDMFFIWFLWIEHNSYEGTDLYRSNIDKSDLRDADVLFFGHHPTKDLFFGQTGNEPLLVVVSLLFLIDVVVCCCCLLLLLLFF